MLFMIIYDLDDSDLRYFRRWTVIFVTMLCRETTQAAFQLTCRCDLV